RSLYRRRGRGLVHLGICVDDPYVNKGCESRERERGTGSGEPRMPSRASLGELDSPNRSPDPRFPVVKPLSRLWAATAAVLLIAPAAAAQDSTVRRLPVVVTVTRDVGRSPLDLPYAITSLRPDS